MSAVLTSRAAALLGLDAPEVLARLLPLLGARVLEEVDAFVAALLAARSGERHPDVLLAAALANRAPRAGHTAVDLLALDGAELASAGREALPEEALPADREAWREQVAASALVREAKADGSTPLVLRGSLLYIDRYFRYEDSLHHELAWRLAEARPAADLGLMERGLDVLFPAEPGIVDGEDRQRHAAELALRRGLTVISGGPGTGKTWTVRNLLTLLYAQAVAAGQATPRLALAAPTGKAAARVAESLRKGLQDHLERAAGALPDGASTVDLAAFLEASTPSTLHRLLGWRPDQPTRFRHDREHPLPVDVLLVDEASMVDLALMSKLFEALPRQARVVLLGDRHQLASVEAGTVLADLCGDDDGGGPVSDGVVFLTHSRRFGPDSGIGRFAASTVAGEVGDAMRGMPPWPPAGPGPLPDEGPVEKDIGRFPPGPPRSWPAAVLEAVVEGFRSYLQRLRAGPREDESLEAFHLDVLAQLDRYRILCAHRGGVFGVSGANDAAQRALATAGLLEPVGAWWLGRPVLVTANDYSVGRYNGDVGLVVRDADGLWAVAFPEERGVTYLPPARMPEHQTVFAMTIHKSQGSEFDDVLVVLPEEPSPVLTRELVYTGITRARRRVSVLGAESVLRYGLERRVRRASGLARAFEGDATSS